MNSTTKASVFAFAVLVAIGAAGAAEANDPGRGRKGSERSYRESGKSYKHHRYDSRHHHNRYYPAHGRVVTVLPHRHQRVHHHGRHFYYSSGVWYRPHGVRYLAVLPPPGISIRVLPPYATTVRLGSTSYYYANSVYYVQGPQGYVVTNPPPEVVAQSTVENAAGDAPIVEERITEEPIVNADAPVADASADSGLYIYPARGQSKSLQEKDRTECHAWAVDQTVYDPLVASTDDTAEDTYGNYRRALSACLEGRGYTVR